MPRTDLIITTSSRATPALADRARTVATRCDARFVPRRGSLPGLLEHSGATLAYVVARDREVLATASERLGVDVGLLHAHRATGLTHPLLRALGPLGADDHVLDATLGLAHDALHVAAVTGARVTGLEIDPALFSLTEAGLARLVAEGETAASRVHPVWADSQETLPTQGPATAVMLSPMFDEPRRAPPGFGLLRHLACHAPLSSAWVDAARQAAPRVVVRARRDQPPPVEPSSIITGKAVDYWVFGPT